MNKNNKFNKAFTLVELLVVMAILGVLVTLIAGGFRTAQARGRDAQRKSDLKQISHALELLMSDYGQYAPDSNGKISACPFAAGTDGVACTWGEGKFYDVNVADNIPKTTYFKKLPTDPVSTYSYFYRVVPGSNNKMFQIFARLENSQDQDCINGNCVNPTAYSCGTQVCNFAVTSPNTSPDE